MSPRPETADLHARIVAAAARNGTSPEQLEQRVRGILAVEPFSISIRLVDRLSKQIATIDWTPLGRSLDRLQSEFEAIGESYTDAAFLREVTALVADDKGIHEFADRRLEIRERLPKIADRIDAGRWQH